MGRGVIIDEKSFLALKREVQSLRLSIRATVARKRAVRIHSPIGGSGAYQWARTRSGGIPAATYDNTGGSESLGLMTAGSALCDLLVSNNDGTYEIQAGQEETIFNGVQSVIGVDTIIGVIQHSDGRLFVIVEDCLSGQQPILTEGETAGPVSSFPEIDETLIGLADDVYIVDEDTSP